MEVLKVSIRGDMFSKIFKLKLNQILLSVFLLVFLFGLISDSWAASPQFNMCAGDKETLRLWNITQGDTAWHDPISANPGDLISFDVYYHNCVTGTVAINTRIKITFPTDFQSQIITTGHLWADNASEVTDPGTINISAPQKLVFEDTAKWYPNQGTTPTILPLTKTSSSVEVNIGDIAGNWSYQGHVVIRAVLVSPPTLSLIFSANPSIGMYPLNDVDLRAEVSGTATGNINYKFDCTGDGIWEKEETSAGTSYIAVDLCDYADPGNYTAKAKIERQGLAIEGTATILVLEDYSLSVTLSAIPAIGTAPLEDVDLRAQVSGTATGDIFYQFDCTSDGTWEREIITDSADYTASDLCDYTSPGIFYPKAKVQRAGVIVEGQTGIIVE